MMRILRGPMALAWLWGSAACGNADPLFPSVDHADGGIEGVADGGACGLPDDDFRSGAAITAAADTWTFIDFPDAKCMDNSSTGIGVNLHPGSDKVVIYLRGGGACFNDLTCSIVQNADGYGATKFAGEEPDLSAYSLFNRDDEANPTKDWNYIYVPYCSGDVHSGTNPSGPGGRAHLGFSNMTRYLERLVPTFPNASRVLLTGSSAGGFGAGINYEQTARAFSCAQVDLLDDAGIPMSDTYLKPCLQQLWRDTWGLDAALPKDCDECRHSDGGGLSNTLRYIIEKHPDRFFGFVSATADSTIRTLFGFGEGADCKEDFALMSEADFEAGLVDLRDDMLTPTPNARMFLMPGTQHTFLKDPWSSTNAATGTNLGAWVAELLKHEGGWKNVGP